MYYISKDPNVERLYHLKDKKGNVVDSRYARNTADAENTFLHNHKELRKKDIEWGD